MTSMATHTLDGHWHDIGSTDDIEKQDVVQRRVGSSLIAVYNIEGRFYATDDLCTHAQAHLSEGYIHGEVIECPLHQGWFHVPTGRALRAPVTEDVRTYPVKVLGNRLYVQLGRRSR